jgi:hypothetical protein
MEFPQKKKKEKNKTKNRTAIRSGHITPSYIAKGN